MFGWCKQEPKIKVKDKWDISAREAIKKYGSATEVMHEIFKDDLVIGLGPMEQLIVQYLKEEYFRKNKDEMEK